MKFEIGEVAIFISDGNGPSDRQAFSGEEIEITGLKEAFALMSTGYKVKWPDGKNGHCIEGCLRKKKPPEEPEMTYSISSTNINPLSIYLQQVVLNKFGRSGTPSDQTGCWPRPTRF